MNESGHVGKKKSPAMLATINTKAPTMTSSGFIFRPPVSSSRSVTRPSPAGGNLDPERFEPFFLGILKQVGPLLLFKSEGDKLNFTVRR